jgi:hypothetical protein
MRKLYMFCAVIIALSLLALAGDKQPKPKLSKEPLTPEQIAVYRAVLQDYAQGGDNITLNLANKPRPLDRSGFDWSEDCVKSLELEPAPKSGSLVHTFDPAVDLGVKVVLVDPEAQTQTVKKNDPGNVIDSGAKSGKPVTDDQIGDAVKKAFNTALFSLSEIVFDKEHKHAVVSYSFYCGGLCGHGGTVILQKSGETWKMLRRCSSWIS